MGRVVPRQFTVVYLRTTTTGWYYDVTDSHTKLQSMVKVSMFGTVVCLRCRATNRCLHVQVARKIHRSLWFDS